MPELVAQVEHPPPVIRRQQPAADIEVGDVGHPAVLQPVLVRVHRGARLLQRAERLAEGHLLVVVQPLVAEDQHGVAVHGAVDLGADLGPRRGAQVEPADLGREERVQGRELQGHRVSSGVIYQAAS